MIKKQIAFTLIVLTTLLNSNSYSQRIQDPALTSGLCINRYDIIIDGFYGYPYLFGMIVEKVLADSLGITGARNYNHFGGKVEYMFRDHIGLGLEYTYALLAIDYQGKNAKYYTIGVSRQRTLAKFNYHFATTQKWDPYLTGGVGYSNTQVYTNEPGIKSETVNKIPISSRIGIGFRYFIRQKFGINMEIGLGGPLMQVGLSFKL